MRFLLKLMLLIAIGFCIDRAFLWPHRFAKEVESATRHPITATELANATGRSIGRSIDSLKLRGLPR